MDERILDLYRIPDIYQYEDIHLLTLSETCAILEEKVFAIVNSLPEKEKQIIREYINTRNDLEYESIKTALRWGKRNYK